MPNDNEFTPTTDEIRNGYAMNEFGEVNDYWVADFDRWLAKFEREVAEKAWERAEFAFERAHNADMLEPWGHMPDNPYRAAPEQEGESDE